jgi:hypothetical protein
MSTVASGQHNLGGLSFARAIDVTSPSFYPGGEWTHVAITLLDPTPVDTGEPVPMMWPARIYVDAFARNPKLIPASAFSGDGISGDVPLVLGGNDDSPFAGEIDEIRIWDHWRSRTEVAALRCTTLTGDEPGLVAHWPLDDDLDDHGPNGLGMTISSGAPALISR